MLPYQQRVVVEKDELDGKIARLTAFLESMQGVTTPHEEYVLLTQQLDHMQNYSAVLGKRITKFEEGINATRYEEV